MNIYALQTARAGSKSVLNKNIMPIKGKELYLHNAQAALESKSIKDLYVSTDCEVIKSKSTEYGYKILDRSEKLAGDNASHHEVMKESLHQIETIIQEKIDILVVLLGNSMGCTYEDLDNAIQILISNPHADSVQSVSEFNMFNPFRAFKINDRNILETIVSQDTIQNNAKLQNINDKNSCGNTYFFNGSFWVCRRETILGNGLLPFTWLGYNILPYIQNPVFELDASWQIEYLKNQ
jgi:N-acylneuraminate cytidylyltransferase